jgi:hypothetical protein
MKKKIIVGVKQDQMETIYELPKVRKPRVKKPVVEVIEFKPITKDSPMVEVLEHPQFKDILDAQIRKERTERANLLNEAGNGSRLKSDSFSVLDKTESLRADRLVIEYVMISNKVSVRASRERYWIKEFIEKCAVLTMLHFEKLAAAKKKAADKSKKPRKPRVKKE